MGEELEGALRLQPHSDIEQRQSNAVFSLMRPDKVIGVRAFIYWIFPCFRAHHKDTASYFRQLTQESSRQRFDRTGRRKLIFQEQQVIRVMKNPVLSSGFFGSSRLTIFPTRSEGTFAPASSMSDTANIQKNYPNFKSAERYPLGKGTRAGIHGHTGSQDFTSENCATR